MSSLKAIKSSIESHRSMKGLVEVYEEMAATTMRKIREAILQSRDYYAGLSVLSSEVGLDFAALPTIKNPQTALIFLSANESLYGDIFDKILSVFLPVVRANPHADVFVIGQVGIGLMRALAPQVRVTSLSLSDDSIKSLYHYQHVQLFYGEFESIARQEPVSRILSSNILELSKPLEHDVTFNLKYLYEPSVEGVARVFAQEIFSGLIEQTSHENDLAKNASRLMHLDQALTNIDRYLVLDVKKYRLSQKRLSSKSQHTQFAGYKVAKNQRKLYV